FHIPSLIETDVTGTGLGFAFAAPRPTLAVNSARASSAPLRSARALWRCVQKSRGRMIGGATPYSLPPSRCCRPQASSSAARLRPLISPLYQQAESCALPTAGHCSPSSTANLPHTRRLTAARGLTQGRPALVRPVPLNSDRPNFQIRTEASELRPYPAPRSLGWATRAAGVLQRARLRVQPQRLRQCGFRLALGGTNSGLR